MNAVLERQALPAAIGTAFEGGIFTDCILVDGRAHAIITARIADGGALKPRAWNSSLKHVEGARSFCDSYANTVAMAKAGSKLAQEALDQAINGYKDWCIGARDVVERQYFRHKPTTDKNWVYRNGENPSAIPAAYPYTADLPAQTTLEAFRAGGAEAFEAGGHWTSTQCEGGADCAWAQDFGNGNQGDCLKDGKFWVRLVRVIAI